MARWEAGGAAHPNGRIVARLQRLTPPTAAASHAAPTATSPSEVNSWPEIDLTAETLRLKERDLGRLGVERAATRGRLADRQPAPDQRGRAAGRQRLVWRGGGGNEQTTLDADLDVHDAGKYLARYALPDAVHDAATRIRGQVFVEGRAAGLRLPDAQRQASPRNRTRPVHQARSRSRSSCWAFFPLQSLKRRLAFDFQDLFGARAFAFDEITGDVRIQNGVMKSDNLKIVGPSARVAIQGEADIARETQHLSVRVQPTLSAGVSVGAAALLLANPVIGAAVYAGSLLAQKAMQDPIEQMFSFGYAVTGSWSDPVVEPRRPIPARRQPRQASRMPRRSERHRAALAACAWPRCKRSPAATSMRTWPQSNR